MNNTIEGMTYFPVSTQIHTEDNTLQDLNTHYLISFAPNEYGGLYIPKKLLESTKTENMKELTIESLIAHKHSMAALQKINFKRSRTPYAYTMAGYIAVTGKEAPDEFCWHESTVIGGFIVDSAKRTHGIGSALLHEFLTYLTHAKLLGIVDTGYIKARCNTVSTPLFLKEGFKIIDEQDEKNVLVRYVVQ